jgi:beta-lactamase class A
MSYHKQRFTISAGVRHVNRSLSILLLAMCVSLACSRTSSSGTNNRPAPPAASPTVRSTPDAELQGQLEQIAALARGRVGMSATVLETGQNVSLNPSEHFPMQSVYKLPISMAVMQQVDQRKLKLDQKISVTREDFIGRAAHSPIRDKNPNGVELTISDLLRFAISESDGTASDALMRLAGGPEAIQSYLSTLQITDMKVVDTEKGFVQDHSLQHRNWSTPQAAVDLLRALHERRGLSEASQGLLLRYMIESTPGARRLKGLLPVGTVVAHKTGTSGTENGITAATNDIGIITLPNGQHLAIAVFIAASPADEQTREGVIAKLAKAVVEAWK